MEQPTDRKTDQYQENNLEVLLEWLESLKIIKKEVSSKIIETETIEKMLTAPAPAVQNKQAIILKSMVPDLG